MKPFIVFLCLFCKTFVLFSNDIFIHDDFNRAKAEARESSKRIFIDFYATWCGPCKKLDKEVFASAEFKAFDKSFVFLKVNGETPSGKILVEKYKLLGYPYAIIADSDGGELDRIRSYHPKEDYLKELTRIEEGNYISVLERNFERHPSYSAGFILAKYYLKENYEKGYTYYQAIKDLSSSAIDPSLSILTADIYRYSIRQGKQIDFTLYFKEIMAHPDDESHALLMIDLADYYLENNKMQEAKRLFDRFYELTTKYKHDEDILKYKRKLEGE